MPRQRLPRSSKRRSPAACYERKSPAVADRPFHSRENDFAPLVGKSKCQHLGHEWADLARREIHDRHDLPADEVFAAVTDGFAEAPDTRIGLIVDSVRNLGVDASHRTVRLVEELKATLGVDLPKMLERATELRPDDGSITDSVGWAYYRLERYEDAVRRLTARTSPVPCGCGPAVSPDAPGPRPATVSCGPSCGLSVPVLPSSHLRRSRAMTDLSRRLDALTRERLLGMRRGIEKESLRVRPDGRLALTPHPAALGSPLTHPNITTDYSESQLELITGAHTGIDACLLELTRVHQFVDRVLREAGDELLWACSMPCGLPTDEAIPLGYYGNSNIGRAKSVYRMGLGHRYGRRMQMISGIHYNWSLPGLGNDEYFALIRNFRRHAFLPLVLLGASPALCATFVEGRTHDLQPLGDRALHLPHATTLRMGRLGYQSEAQASLAVSYNGLEGYAASLHDALTQPYPAYERIGIRNPGGDYNQLATTLLQIENEFYGVIRPKRTIFPGERPLHALRERGVEYVEVRLIDLDPFEPVGIGASAMRFLDVFLLHCLLSDSPPDSPAEIARNGENQQRTAARGREPGLRLLRGSGEIELTVWGDALLVECEAIAHRLDARLGGGDYTEAVAQARAQLASPDRLPSARVLDAIRRAHGGSYVAFGREQSRLARQHLLGLPWLQADQSAFERASIRSLEEQRAVEAADTLPFEEFRKAYIAPQRLVPRRGDREAAQRLAGVAL